MRMRVWVCGGRVYLCVREVCREDVRGVHEDVGGVHEDCVWGVCACEGYLCLREVCML